MDFCSAFIALVTSLSYASLQIARTLEEQKRTEEELRRSRENYKLLFDMSPDALFIVSENSVFIDVNQIAVDRYGYSKEELLTMGPGTLAAPSLKEEAKVKLKNALDSPTHFEWVHCCRDGREIPVEIHTQPFFVDGKRCTFSEVRDITQRKKYELELTESREKFLKAFHNSPDSMMLSSISDGRIVDANKKFLSATGFTQEETIGKTTVELGLWVNESQRDAFIQELLSNERIDNLECDFKLSTGEVRTFLLSAEKIPINDQLLMLSVTKDITEQKTMVEALRKSDELYRSVLDNIIDVYYRRDNDGNIIMASSSAAQLLGFESVDEVIGRNVEFFWQEPAKRSEFLALMETGKVKDYEIMIMKKDGNVIPVSVSCNYFYDKDGNRAGVEGIVRDISERKQMEQTLRKSENLYRSFVEASRDAMYVVQDGIIKYANPGCADLTGVPVEQLIGSGIYQFVHAGDAEVAKTITEQFICGVIEKFERNIRFIIPGGVIKMLFIKGVRIEWEGASALLCIASMAEEQS
jgi:PAS domain S-box-containing protein